MPATDGSGSWMHCSIDVEGRHVDISVRRFDEDEQRRVAAEVAWFAEALLTGGDLGATDWSGFLQRILSPNVSLTLDEQGLDNAAPFWDQLFRRTLEVLLVANGLDPAIRKHLQTSPIRV